MEIARVLIPFCLAVLFLPKLQASPGIGLSARLKSNVKVPASAATVIAGWDSSGYFIFFEYGIKLVEKDKGSMVKGSVVLPIKGLFLVSASLMLDSKQDMKLEVCITKDICQQTEQNEHTVTVAIQNYFPKDEVIYIRIYAIEPVTLLRLSSFSVQYLGPFSMMAGFLAALDQDTTLVKRKGENFVTVKDWLKNAENGVRREQEPTLKDTAKVYEKLTVRCSGVYLVTLSLSIKAIKYDFYEVRMISNSAKVRYTKKCAFDGVVTISLLRNVQLNKGDEVTVQVRATGSNEVLFLRGSRFAAVFIGKKDSDYAEFVAPLKGKIFDSGVDTAYLSGYIPERVIKQKKIDLSRRRYQFAMPCHGVYVVTLHLNLKISAMDSLSAEILAYDRGLKGISSVYGRSGTVRCETQTSAFNKTTLVLTGVFALIPADYTFISLASACRKQFIMLEGSWVSFMAVRSHDMVASYSTRGQSQLYTAMPIERGLVLNATQPSVFPLGESTSADKTEFVCPISGIFLINMNLVVSRRKSMAKIVNIQVVKQSKSVTNSGPIRTIKSAIFDVNITVFDGLTTLTPTFVATLREKDVLSFHILSNPKLDILEDSSIFLSLIDFVETGRTFIAEYPKHAHYSAQSSNAVHLLTSWVPKTVASTQFGSRKAPKKGFYIISCYIHLVAKFNVSSGGIALAFNVYFDGTNADFGLRDAIEVVSKGNGIAHLYLGVSGVLEASENATLITSLSSNKDNLNATILSGQLLMSVYTPSEYGTETFRSLQSSTKLLSLKTDNFASLDRRVYANTNGEFKSEGVGFVGIRFQAYKSILAFVCATTVFHGVEGTVRYGVFVNSASNVRVKAWTITADVSRRQLKTLKWIGLVYMEPFQQLSLEVKLTGKISKEASKGYSRVSWSSLSFVALSSPDSADQSVSAVSDGWYLAVQLSPLPSMRTDVNTPTQSAADSSSLIELQDVRRGSQYSFNANASVAVSLPKFKFGDAQYLQGDFNFHNVSKIDLGEILYPIRKLRSYLKNVPSLPCLVGIMSMRLHVQLSSPDVIMLVYQTLEDNATISAFALSEGTRNILEFNGILCINRILSLSLIASKRIANITISKKSLMSLALIGSATNIEGFSVSQKTSKEVTTQDENDVSSKGKRLDDWVATSVGFDSSLGFRMPFGCYVSQASGKYLATANIILAATAECIVTIALYRNGASPPMAMLNRIVSNATITTFNLAALIEIQNWNVLELQISSNCHAKLSVTAGSSFSMVLLDQDMTIQRCEAELLQLKAFNQTEIAMRIGADVVLDCGTVHERIVDYYWLQNGKVFRSMLSSSSGTLVIKSATKENSGDYVCRAQTGDFYVESQKIKVIVYDPTPRVFVVDQTINVPENSPQHQLLTKISVKSATPHQSEDAMVHLTIKPDEMNDIFYIAPEKTRAVAVLKSRLMFDYETRDQYNITLTATNIEFAGVAKYSMILQLKITDENDNPPEFEKSSFTVGLLENAAIGTTVFSLKAHDKDIGANAEIEYYLHGNADSRFFLIGKKSGIIVLNGLIKLRRRRSFVLFAIARNGQFRTFAEVTVNVIDINDNRPYFEQNFYQVNVTETTSLGTTVATILAHDLDIEIANRNITYELKNASINLPFLLDRFGNIKVSQNLAKFSGIVFEAQAIAFDGQGLRSSNDAKIVFRVIKTVFLSSFDSGLRFTNDVYQIKVREDVPVGTLVTKVEAFNPDNAYYSLRYIFVKPASNYNFTISATTGEIHTGTRLNYELQKDYSLTVFACDVNGVSDCTAARVDIKIEDVNDNVPVFSKLIYRAEVNESCEIGSFVDRVIATDADTGPFGIVQYKFDHNGTGFPFTIGKVDGVIRVAKDLKTIRPSLFVASIRASDNGGSENQVLIELQIKRNKTRNRLSNDTQLPKFDTDFYSIDVREDCSINKKLADIRLSYTEAARVEYALLVNDNDTFRTDPAIGGLYLEKQLDYERTKTYNLFLIAEFNDDVILRSYTRLRVSVIDVNDNRPMFAERSQTVFLKGTLKPGRLVTRLRAYDEDSGINGRMQYFINTAAEMSEFVLDSETGDLMIKSVGTAKKYILPVVACDYGTPKLCDNATVVVHVTADAFEGGIESSLVDFNYTYADLMFYIDQYTAGDYTAIRFIAQEVHKEHPLYVQYTQLTPVSWYDVNYRRSEGNNYLRRYVASEKSVGSDLFGRIRRDILTEKKKVIRFKYGDGKDCGEVWKADQICNGPLHPGTKYRFQLEIKHKGSKFFLKTGFTKTYKTGPFTANSQLVTKKITEYKFPYWIALIAVSCLFLLLIVIFLVCCCCYRRRKRLRKKYRYDIAVQKDSFSDQYPMQWKTDSESQEITVRFSEESVCNGSIPHMNSKAL